MEEIKIDLTNSELFKSLLDIDYSKLSHYDIHNDFDLKLLEYKEGAIFIMHFSSVIDKKMVLKVVFENPKFIEFSVMVNDKNLTVDNFHRGKFEYKGKLYEEYENRKCFYIEFYEEGGINILASKVLMQVSKETKVIDLPSND